MSNNAHDLTNRLLNALDSNYNVVDMHAVIEIISILEKINITKELLETTRLGKHVNELRRRACEPSLARRAKLLVKRWRDQVIPPANNAQGGQGRSSAEPQARPAARLGGTPLTSPALSRVVSPADPSPRSISRHGISPPAPLPRPVSVASYDSDSQDVIVVEDDDQRVLPVTHGLIRPGSPLNISDSKRSKRDKKSKKKSKSHSRSGSGTESTTPAKNMTFPASPGISPAKPNWLNRNGVAHSPAKPITPSTLVSPSMAYRTQTSPGVPSFPSMRSSPSLTAVRSPSLTGVRSPAQTLTAAQQLAAREGIKIPPTSPAIQMVQSTRTPLSSPALQLGLKTTSPALATAAQQLAAREGIRLAGQSPSAPPLAPLVPPTKRNGCRQKKKKQVEDYGSFIRNKIPQAGVKKVKTTKELLEDLQARKLGLSSATNSPLPSGDEASRDSACDGAVPDVATPGAAGPAARPGSPRRKDKARDRKGKSKKDDSQKETNTANTPKPFEPLDSILARLPPLPSHIHQTLEVDHLVCHCPDIDTRSEDCPVHLRMLHPCRPEHIFALHNAYMPCVNGNTAPPLVAPEVDLKPLKDPDRPDLFLNVVPKYNYLDYADDRCVKNLSRVSLANDFEWTDLYFPEDPTWSMLKAEPLPDLYRRDSQTSENESGNMNGPSELDVRLGVVDESSRHSDDSRMEINGNSDLVYNSAVFKCKTNDSVDNIKMDVETNFDSDRIVIDSDQTNSDTELSSGKVIIEGLKTDFVKADFECEQSVESEKMDVDEQSNSKECDETNVEVKKVDIDGKMLVELSSNALSAAKLNYGMVNPSKIVEFKEIDPDIEEYLRVGMDEVTTETKSESTPDFDTLERLRSAGDFGEWHEPIVLGSLLALPYVVID